MEMENLKNYVIFDFETSGLNVLEDDIIFIYGIKVMNGKRVGKFRAFIKPENKLIPAATRLTGITNRRLSNKPAADYIMPIFQEYINGLEVVTLNTSFFKKFYENRYKEYFSHDPLSDSVDLLLILKELFPNIKNIHREDVLIQLFNIDDYERNKRIECNCSTEIYYRCFLKMQELICRLHKEPIDITNEELDEIIKMDDKSAIELQKTFNWAFSKAALIHDYLSICKYTI